MTVSPPAVPAATAPRRAASAPAAMLLPAAFTAAVFTSAFLLFVLQPMFGKMVLPLLGGSPAVWNTCMLFFQAALLGGYLYAHLSSRLPVRAQALLHLVFLAAAALALPLSTGGRVPAAADEPVGWLLGVMAAGIGPPFVALAATAPMLQRWFAASGHRHAHDPYPLYAASNLGSMAALLSYPLLVEPGLRLGAQAGAWSGGYGLLVLLIGGCAALAWRGGGARVSPAADLSDDADVGVGERARWVGLAFVPSSLLLGVTAFITTDITPVPLFWVIPLALYLLSFAIVFARRPVIRHAWMLWAQPPVLAVVALLLTDYVQRPLIEIPLHLAALFITAMVCHGELARRRPPVRHLTSFYLWIAVGGVLGGVFNVLVAPRVFTDPWEYPLVLLLACLARPWPGRRPLAQHARLAFRAAVLAVLLVLLTGDAASRLPVPFWLAPVFLTLVILALALGRAPGWLAACLGAVVAVGAADRARHDERIHAERTFFGHYAVRRVELRSRGATFHTLSHGTTLHGAQNRAPGERGRPLTYYQEAGPLGGIFRAARAESGPLRVGVVGLGTGTAAAYARPGDRWTFYEIDPGIVRVARDTALFTFLADAPVQPRMVVGDARLSLARDTGRFDLLLLDAFTSDAVPTHLLTAEALRTYVDRLAPGGMLAFHVSNRYYDLQSVLAAATEELGMAARMGIGPRTRRHRYEQAARWIVVARREADLGAIGPDERWTRPENRAGIRPWTDDHSAVLSVFSW